MHSPSVLTLLVALLCFATGTVRAQVQPVHPILSVGGIASVQAGGRLTCAVAGSPPQPFCWGTLHDTARYFTGSREALASVEVMDFGHPDIGTADLAVLMSGGASNGHITCFAAGAGATGITSAEGGVFCMGRCQLGTCGYASPTGFE